MSRAVILDYSQARPTVAQLKAHGVTAVGRYIGWDNLPGHPGMGKNITPAEARTLVANGIAVFLVFEYLADAARSGWNQGAADGALASVQLAELGAPPGVTVYFALDWDIGDYAPAYNSTNKADEARHKLGPVARYFDAVNAAAAASAAQGGPVWRPGVYGGYWAVKRVLDAGLAVMGWQTVAWSGGQTVDDPRCVLFQDAKPPPIPFTDSNVRLHTAAGPDFGQWPRPVVPPKPQPPKPPTVKETSMILYHVDRDPATPTVPGPGIFTYSGGVLAHVPDQHTVDNLVAAGVPLAAVSYAYYQELTGAK